MAAFNGEKYIATQIESILSQLSENDEVIISDDGSSDATLDIIKSIDDSRIHVVKNEGEHGYTGNFENALKFSRGDVIFLSDQDDIWCDNKVSSCLDVLKDSDFVITDATVIDSDRNVLGSSYFKLRHTRFGFLNSWLRCRYLGCCYAFNRNVLSVALPFPANHKLLPHDLWLALLAEFYFKVKYLKYPHILYRRHSNNVSDGGVNSKNSLSVKILMRFYSLYKVLAARYVN